MPQQKKPTTNSRQGTNKQSAAAKSSSAKSGSSQNNTNSQNKYKVTQNKSSRKPSDGAGSATPKRGGDPERIIHQFMPYILALIALFLIISFFVADSTGFVGGFLKKSMLGLFSYGAYIIPILLLCGAIFWKRDVASGLLVYKFSFSLACVTFISVLVNAFARHGENAIPETFSPITLFNNGCERIGGGIMGGLVGNVLLKGFGFAGTLIFSIALLLLFGIFLFGMTPNMLAVYIITAFREWRSNLGSRMEDSKNEREKMLAEYEAKRSRELEMRRMAEAAMQNGNAAKNVRQAPANTRRRKVNDALDEDYDSGDSYVDESVDIPFDMGEPQSEPPIDEAIFDEVLAETNAKLGNMVESDAPPFNIDGEDHIDARNASRSGSREKVEPLPKTSSQILTRMEEDEAVSLEKIFAEPSSELEDDIPEPGVSTDDVITSAEIDLMVEKSRLEVQPIILKGDEADDADEDAEIDSGKLKMQAVKPEPPAPDYLFPPISLLKMNLEHTTTDMSGEIQQTATKLVETLRSFNVKTKIVNVSRGPTVTRYELQPEVGTKVRSIVNLVDDIALHLATSGVRIEAPIPGKEAVGIEVPNRNTSTVYIRELLENSAFKQNSSKVITSLGMDVAGNPVYLDVAKMPHLLIAGTTGSGKSVCINALIISMLYKARPDEVKFIMIDPKKVELNVYNGIPHLLVPVVSDPKKAAGSLHWAVTEMERRYELIEGAGVRNLKGYNQSIANDPTAEQLPQIVIIIDELADLMMMARDDVEESICRIAQKARAAGMHLILGTQRPTVDVVTGLIKANVPSRIAFTTFSQMDSRTIIDTVGAEKLIGRGDMLYSPIGSVKPTRVQGCFVSDDEVEEVTSFIKANYGVRDYDQSVIDTIEREAQLCGNKKATVSGDGDIEANDGDPMLRPAISLAVESGKISTSLIQRRLQLGYGRAAKLIDTMEDMGIVGPAQGQKPREVLISKHDYMEMELRRSE